MVSSGQWLAPLPLCHRRLRDATRTLESPRLIDAFPRSMPTHPPLPLVVARADASADGTCITHFVTVAATWRKQHQFRTRERLDVLQRGLLKVAPVSAGDRKPGRCFPITTTSVVESPGTAENPPRMRSPTRERRKDREGNCQDKTLKRKVWHNCWETLLDLPFRGYFGEVGLHASKTWSDTVFVTNAQRLTHGSPHGLRSKHLPRWSNDLSLQIRVNADDYRWNLKPVAAPPANLLLTPITPPRQAEGCSDNHTHPAQPSV